MYEKIKYYQVRRKVNEKLYLRKIDRDVKLSGSKKSFTRKWKNFTEKIKSYRVRGKDNPQK